MTEHAPDVVITRPMGQAQLFAQRVAAIGRTPAVFPLLEILPLADTGPLQEELQNLRRYAMVSFVSPNAIDVVFSMIREWPSEVAIAVMGEGSRAALARHGVTAENARIFSPRDPQRTDSQTLLAVLDLEALRGRHVLVIRGESGRELLADALREAGVAVKQVAAYRRTAPVLDSEHKAHLRHLLNAGCDWVITSSEALRILVGMITELGESDAVMKMQMQHLIVPHSRIAETAEALGFQRVTLTGSGDEHLLATLQSQA